VHAVALPIGVVHVGAVFSVQRVHLLDLTLSGDMEDDGRYNQHDLKHCQSSIDKTVIDADAEQDQEAELSKVGAYDKLSNTRA
jgi:hypothetical protein